MDIYTDIGVSFFISGVIYVLLAGLGLDFLEDFQIGVFSAMTVAVFILKHMLL